MDRPNIVVIGGSAGALRPLQHIVAHLPAELPIAVFAVIHGGSDVHRMLASLVPSAGALGVRSAQDRDPIAIGTVSLAPPDQHLIIKEGFLRLLRTPRETLWRPAIDVLFRSAAVAYGSQVIGVILSGALDDGSAGGHAIKRCGGTVIVQSPADAQVPDMPRSVVRAAHVDYVIRHQDIPAVIQQVVARVPTLSPLVPDDLLLEAQFAEGTRSADRDDTVTSTRHAPSCISLGGISRAHLALWAAIRHFEQRANWHWTLSCEHQCRGRTRAAVIEGERALEAQAHASELRKLIWETHPTAIA